MSSPDKGKIMFVDYPSNGKLTKRTVFLEYKVMEIIWVKAFSHDKTLLSGERHENFRYKH